MQYDGSELAIGNEKRGLIYEVSDREVTGTTRLGNACRVRQFFIERGRLIAPNACDGKDGLNLRLPLRRGADKGARRIKSPFVVVAAASRFSTSLRNRDRLCGLTSRA